MGYFVRLFMMEKMRISCWKWVETTCTLKGEFFFIFYVFLFFCLFIYFYFWKFFVSNWGSTLMSSLLIFAFVKCWNWLCMFFGFLCGVVFLSGVMLILFKREDKIVRSLAEEKMQFLWYLVWQMWKDGAQETLATFLWFMVLGSNKHL